MLSYITFTEVKKNMIVSVLIMEIKKKIKSGRVWSRFFSNLRLSSSIVMISSPLVYLCFDWLLIANDVYRECSFMIYVIPFLDDSTRFCINKNPNYI